MTGEVLQNRKVSRIVAHNFRAEPAKAAANPRVAHRLPPERATFAPLAHHARKHQRIVNAMRRRELAGFAAHDKQARKAAGRPS